LMANLLAKSLQECKKGLQLLAANGQWQEFHFEAKKISSAYEEAGAEEESKAILELLNLHQERAETANRDKSEDSSNKVGLPSKCPFCGASLSLEQVRSGREIASECKYCGSVVISRKIS